MTPPSSAWAAPAALDGPSLNSYASLVALKQAVERAEIAEAQTAEA